MDTTTLQDIFPETAKPAQFKLTATGEDVYTLRAPTLQDTVEISRLVGDFNAINRAFAEKDYGAIGKLIYLLLDQEAKTKFKARDITEVDVEGEELTRRVSGAEVLMRATSLDDIDAMSVAVLQAYANSSPKIRESFKKANAEKKTKLLNQRIGVGSSTPLQVSTDTPATSSVA